MAGGDGTVVDLRTLGMDAIRRLEEMSVQTWEAINDLRGSVAQLRAEMVPMIAESSPPVIINGNATDDQMAAIIHRMQTAAGYRGSEDPPGLQGDSQVARAMPVRSFIELRQLVEALGGDLGARHGEAVAHGEIGAVDAWQVALTALAHLRSCITSALQAAPNVPSDPVA